MGRFGPAWDAPEWDKTSPKTWDEWTDVLGNTFKPGDHVAVATVNDKSPQMVIGKVMQINRVDSKGSLILDKETEYVACEPDDPGARQMNRWHVDHGWVPEEGWYLATPKWVDSCTVKIQPLLDARGFYRGYGTDLPRPVVYRLWENIIKIDATQYIAAEEAEHAAVGAEIAALREEM